MVMPHGRTTSHFKVTTELARFHLPSLTGLALAASTSQHVQGRRPESAGTAPAAGRPLEMALLISWYIAEYTAFRTAMGCLAPNSSTTSTLPAV